GGALLYLALELTTNSNKVTFLVCTILILSFYGAGFATIPAYLRDLFGTYHVSAIHGRLLTAWSVAGVLGPVLVNYMREYQLEHGADRASAYQTVLHVMAGLLVFGFVANLLVRPVAQKYWLPEGAKTMQASRPKSAARV